MKNNTNTYERYLVDNYNRAALKLANRREAIITLYRELVSTRRAVMEQVYIIICFITLPLLVIIVAGLYSEIVKAASVKDVAVEVFTYGILTIIVAIPVVISVKRLRRLYGSAQAVRRSLRSWEALLPNNYELKTSGYAFREDGTIDTKVIISNSTAVRSAAIGIGLTFSAALFYGALYTFTHNTNESVNSAVLLLTGLFLLITTGISSYYEFYIARRRQKQLKHLYVARFGKPAFKAQLKASLITTAMIVPTYLILYSKFGRGAWLSLPLLAFGELALYNNLVLKFLKSSMQKNIISQK